MINGGPSQDGNLNGSDAVLSKLLCQIPNQSIDALRARLWLISFQDHPHIPQISNTILDTELLLKKEPKLALNPVSTLKATLLCLEEISNSLESLGFPVSLFS